MVIKSALNGYEVAAIIVNWNSGKLLRSCIESLKAQIVPFKKIIIVDNASTDGSADEFDKSNELIMVSRLKTNHGFAGGCNYGISQIESCDWIALINPDVTLEPEWLQNMIEAINRNTDASFFASRILKKNMPNVLDGIGDAYHISGLVWRKWHGMFLKDAEMREGEVFSPCAAAALYKYNVVKNVGGFDINFFCYVEDVDLGFRLRLMGHRCIVVPSAIAHHVGSATTGGKHSNFAVYHGQRNLIWAFFKNMPGILFWLFLPLHIFINIANVLRFTVQGQGSVVLKAKWDAIKGIPAMWKKRKLIQSKRIVTTRAVLKMLDKRLLLWHHPI